jgi:serine protease Do
MKRYIIRSIGTLACVGLLANFSFAQKDNKSSDKLGDDQELVIKKKGDKKSKITIEINDGNVKVNGKPLSEFNSDELSVEIENEGLARIYAPRSPFRAGSLNAFNDNSAFLGVMTEKVDNGARITSVTKGSAAEKAGLKVGDIITTVGDTKIEDPQDLTDAIRDRKPDDKVSIKIKRDNRNESVTATLGKRSSATVYAPDMGNFDFRLNEDMLRGGDFNLAFGGRGRLGIRAQDLEEGNGAKVLSVENESNAAKAGIKEGDIITEFDGKAVASATELAELAREAREKNNIRVKVTRDGKSQDLEIKVPKKLKTATL